MPRLWSCLSTMRFIRYKSKDSYRTILTFIYKALDRKLSKQSGEAGVIWWTKLPAQAACQESKQRERWRERGNDIFKLCWETDFNLLVLWLLSTALHRADRWQIRWYSSSVAVTKYFYRKKNQLVQSECFIVLNQDHLTFSAFVVSFVMSQFICIFFCQEEGVIKGIEHAKI